MSQKVEFSVSDHAELSSLERYLRAKLPGTEVTQVSGAPGPGEQGGLPWLEILGSSSVIVTAIKTVPLYLQARKPGLAVNVKVKGTTVSVSGGNVDEVMKVLDKVLDD